MIYLLTSLSQVLHFFLNLFWYAMFYGPMSTDNPEKLIPCFSLGSYIIISLDKILTDFFLLRVLLSVFMLLDWGVTFDTTDHHIPSDRLKQSIGPSWRTLSWFRLICYSMKSLFVFSVNCWNSELSWVHFYFLYVFWPMGITLGNKESVDGTRPFASVKLNAICQLFQFKTNVKYIREWVMQDGNYECASKWLRTTFI